MRFIRIQQGWVVVVACIVLILGCTGGCTGESAPADAAEDSSGSGVGLGDAGGSGLGVPADRSLTLGEYIKAGMPAYDREWSGEDMARAAVVLTGIAEKDPGHLPRYESEKSGELFGRLTEPGLGMYRDRSLPVQSRIVDLLTYMESTNPILKLYYAAAVEKQAVGGSELVEVMGAQLRVVVVMMELLDAFYQPLTRTIRATVFGWMG